MGSSPDQKRFSAAFITHFSGMSCVAPVASITATIRALSTTAATVVFPSVIVATPSGIIASITPYPWQQWAELPAMQWRESDQGISEA
jgi:hypothetical protein